MILKSVGPRSDRRFSTLVRQSRCGENQPGPARNRFSGEKTRDSSATVGKTDSAGTGCGDQLAEARVYALSQPPARHPNRPCVISTGAERSNPDPHGIAFQARKPEIPPLRSERQTARGLVVTTSWRVNRSLSYRTIPIAPITESSFSSGLEPSLSLPVSSR